MKAIADKLINKRRVYANATSGSAAHLLLLAITVHSGTRAVVATDESASAGLLEHVCKHGRTTATEVSEQN